MSTAAVKSETATLKNLQAAYNGESNAHARYLVFAVKAAEEGFAGVASLFRAAARAEKIHANNHAVVIRKMNAEPQATIEAGPVRSTRENLMAAIEGETYERDVMYPEFIKIAQQENNPAAIRTFNYALEAETEHARLYADALAELPSHRGRTTYLVCAVCGFTAEKLEGARCPVCNNPKERFETVS
ncbi:MAG: rubrerythrin family protein [Terriglobales bacterium]